MSRRQRAALLVGAAVVAVVALIVIRPGGDDSTSTVGQAQPTQQRQAGGNGRSEGRRPPKPSATVIRVRGGEPVGGVQTLRAKKGEMVRVVVSADAPEEVHLHGYDVARPVAPGRPARLRLRASIEGVFEIELENSATQIAKLEVAP